MVISSSTWFRRSAREGSTTDPPLPLSWSSTEAPVSWPVLMSAWAASAATTPLTVIAMLSAASTTRRGRRAATRSPRSSGTGSLAESAITQPLRRGGRAASASARTVLVRAARTAGISVAATATASATAITVPTADMVSGGAPVRPRSPALGSVSSGAASHPSANPAAAASRATTTYSARSTAATRPGVPPTALSSPTRRIWSAIRPPTRTATLATARTASSHAPVSNARRWFSTRFPLAARMSCQASRLGDCRSEGLGLVPTGGGPGGRLRSATNADAAAGSASFRYST